MTAAPHSYLADKLLDVADRQPNLSIIGLLIEAAGLRNLLSGPEDFTILAPTDAAFAELPRGALDRLLRPECRHELLSLLHRHILPGRRPASMLAEGGAMPTLGHGRIVPRRRRGRLEIDGALLTSADIESANGLIHAIDRINLPARADASVRDAEPAPRSGCDPQAATETARLLTGHTPRGRLRSFLPNVARSFRGRATN